jgi:hypothetical protein
MRGRQHGLTHGMTRTPEHRTWSGIKTRCTNPRSALWKHYGGRGITMCERWRVSFEAFYADMGPRPRNGSIERLDNDGPYAPENCVWIDRWQQQRNMTTSHRLTFNGETLLLADWARRCGISSHTLTYRLKSGWPIDEALTTPILCRRDTGLRAAAARAARHPSG